MNMGRTFDSDVNDEKYRDFCGPAVHCKELDSHTLHATTADTYSVGASKEWLEINGEGIYGTTFWKTFGEGKVNAEDGFFKDNDEKPFTNMDFRFTYKNGYLYAFQMQPSKTVKIKTLKRHNPHDYLIESIELLGSHEKIAFERNEKCLKISLKEKPKTDLPICFKIAIG